MKGSFDKWRGSFFHRFGEGGLQIECLRCRSGSFVPTCLVRCCHIWFLVWDGCGRNRMDNCSFVPPRHIGGRERESRKEKTMMMMMIKNTGPEERANIEPIFFLVCVLGGLGV